MEAALWSDADDDVRKAEPSKALWKRAKRDCKAFVKTVGDIIEAWPADQVGRDLWLTRNRHGIGFWERGENGSYYTFELTKAAHNMGECNLYVSRGKVFAL